MENSTETNTNKKSNPAVLIILIILIVAIVGYGVWQSTSKKDNQQKETTTVSTTAETTKSTTELTTQTTTEQTTKKREPDSKMMDLVSHTYWESSSKDNMSLSNGAIDWTDSSYTEDMMFYSIYARNDNQYDFEVTYKDQTTEEYIMVPDFSYDGERLYYDSFNYDNPEFPSYMNLQGNGKLSGKWLFKGYFG